MNTLDPQAGQWYHFDKGEMFQVIDADAKEGWVETQLFDGDIERLSDEEWRALDIETCEPPEDWTRPYDDIERDDLATGHGYERRGLARACRRRPGPAPARLKQCTSAA